MSTKPTVTSLNDDAVRVSWGPLVQGDTCDAFSGLSEYADRSVQIKGTFGGATLAVKGSNDGSNFETLTDPLGSAISRTTDGLKQITEYTHLVNPVLTGGDGNTSITVTLVAKRQRR